MRTHPTRTIFVPAGAIRVADKASTAVAHIYTTHSGKPAAIVFAGKAQKPSWHFRFASDAQREKRVRAFFEAIARVEAARRDRRADRRA